MHAYFEDMQKEINAQGTVSGGCCDDGISDVILLPNGRGDYVYCTRCSKGRKAAKTAKEAANAYLERCREAAKKAA